MKRTSLVLALCLAAPAFAHASPTSRSTIVNSVVPLPGRYMLTATRLRRGGGNDGVD